MLRLGVCIEHLHMTCKSGIYIGHLTNCRLPAIGLKYASGKLALIDVYQTSSPLLVNLQYPSSSTLVVSLVEACKLVDDL